MPGASKNRLEYSDKHRFDLLEDLLHTLCSSYFVWYYEEM